jgi:hypothetical protein
VNKAHQRGGNGIHSKARAGRAHSRRRRRHQRRAAQDVRRLPADGGADDQRRRADRRLEEMLSKIADFYDDEVDAAVTA